jgi:putative transposase
VPHVRRFTSHRHKEFNCYKGFDLGGLYDHSRTPYWQANELAYQLEGSILWIKKDYPTWGAPQIRAKLV